MQWPLPLAGADVFSLNPTLVPSYSNSLGFCDNLYIDFSASKGSGPFPWELLTFTTASCTGLTGVTDNCLLENNPINANATIDQVRLLVKVPRTNFPLGTGQIVFQASLRNVIGETTTEMIKIDLVADAKPTFILAGNVCVDLKLVPQNVTQRLMALLVDNFFFLFLLLIFVLCFAQVHRHVTY